MSDGVVSSYTDIHFHILPGVDDGATNLKMALEMAKLAIEDGVSTLVATPHPNLQTGIGSRTTTREITFTLQQVLDERGLHLRLVPGVECFLVPEITELLQSGQLFGLNESRYVLIEFNHVVPPVNIEQVMFSLRTAGYVPIIAHPERYKYLQSEDLRWLPALVEQGCLLQLTAGAFYGRFGARCQQAANRLVQLNMAHIIASDAHNVGVRAPGLSPARSVIEGLVGPGVFEKMASQIPALVVADEPYEPPLPEKVGARPFWKIW